jgi:C4-dicarboxylate-binding protein DctP
MTITKTTLTAAALSLMLCPLAQAKTVMRCSHQLPPTHHVAKVIDRWAAEVKKLSSDDLDVQIFGADSLVKANDNILAVAKGQIECAFSVNFQWGKTLPLMNVTLAPYSMSSLELWRKWPDSEAAQFLEKKLEEKGVKNIAWLFQTNSDVFTSSKKPLIAPADFKDVKIRGLGDPFDQALVAMGAVPATLPGSEVYQALATGVIDAGLTDVAAAYSRKYYEVQQYMTVTPVLSVYLHGYVNPSFYTALSDKDKKALKQAGKDAAGWAVDAAAEAVKDAPKELRAKGVKLHVATDAENKALKTAMRPAFDRAFAAQAGEDGKELLKLVEKLEQSAQ